TENNLKKLVHADVFRSFGYNTKTLISNIDALLNYAEISNGLDIESVSEPYLIIEKEYDKKELRLIERETFGFYVSNHPSASYQNNVLKIEKVESNFNKKVNMIVVCELIDSFKTKKNENMASITISDETGEMEAIIFPSVYKQIEKINEGDILLIKGTVGKRYSDYQIMVDSIVKKNE
ncbi:MAG: hypothetical protein K6G37_00800, partial [Bacilli bacterium]|nr:hypothetical protein [Bacilli bacterium]